MFQLKTTASVKEKKSLQLRKVKEKKNLYQIHSVHSFINMQAIVEMSINYFK